MKTKTLMTMAVAGTFGLSAAAFAGSNHEVVTPFSISEAGENIFVHNKGFSESYHQSAMGSTSHEASGSVSGNALISSESRASISMDESLALANEGIYSDFYVVSWAPVMVESWDLYVLNTGDRDELAAADSLDIAMPTHELALVSTDDGSTFEVALVPIESMEWVEIG